LTQTGAAVPRPYYVGYRSSLVTVPGVPNGGTVPAYVNLMGADFRAPVTWKASASYARRVTKTLTLTGTFQAGETRHNYQHFDRNLREEPAFTLDNEEGRAVFVPANTIPATGRTT